MISFDLFDMADAPWPTISGIGEINPFQTQAWLRFLVDTQKGYPVIAAVNSDGRNIGYFTGMIVRRFGLKILGSPFRGWASYFMGFNLLPGSSYREVLQAFPSFVFNDLGCHYLEVIDPNLHRIDCIGLPYKVQDLPWFAIDLTQSEEELFAAMKSAGRRAIRKSNKSGVTIEEGCDAGYADEYYAQYSDVLKKRSLVPTYSLDTVRKMLNHTAASGNILALRARNSESLCIATWIFLYCNKRGVYWGGASWRDYQSDRPNEALAWYGMNALKTRGIRELHLGGECQQFKEKLGSHDAEIFRIMKARNPILDCLINIVLSGKSSRLKNWALRKL